MKSLITQVNENLELVRVAAATMDTSRIISETDVLKNVMKDYLKFESYVWDYISLNGMSMDPSIIFVGMYLTNFQSDLSNHNLTVPFWRSLNAGFKGMTRGSKLRLHSKPQPLSTPWPVGSFRFSSLFSTNCLSRLA